MGSATAGVERAGSLGVSATRSVAPRPRVTTGPSPAPAPRPTQGPGGCVYTQAGAGIVGANYPTYCKAPDVAGELRNGVDYRVTGYPGGTIYVLPLSADGRATFQALYDGAEAIRAKYKPAFRRFNYTGKVDFPFSQWFNQVLFQERNNIPAWYSTATLPSGISVGGQVQNFLGIPVEQYFMIDSPWQQDRPYKLARRAKGFINQVIRALLPTVTPQAPAASPSAATPATPKRLFSAAPSTQAALAKIQEIYGSTQAALKEGTATGATSAKAVLAQEKIGAPTPEKIAAAIAQANLPTGSGGGSGGGGGGYVPSQYLDHGSGSGYDDSGAGDAGEQGASQPVSSEPPAPAKKLSPLMIAAAIGAALLLGS